MPRRAISPDQRAQIVSRLCKALKEGNTRTAACSYAGIDKHTLYRWLEKDSHFSHAIEKAEGQAEQSYVTLVTKAAKTGNWQAAAWWLERRRPGEWGRKDHVDVSGSTQMSITRTMVILTDDCNPPELPIEEGSAPAALPVGQREPDES